MQIHRVVRALILILALSASTASMAQPQQGPGSIRPSENPTESDSVRDFKKEIAKKANKERQEQIRRDTEKLLKLATELKAYVDKTDEHILSLDVLKKAEEIEKLAHSVKEKMKTSY